MMNKTHRKTLEAIFCRPVPSSLEWRRIESLLKAVGADVIEGAGSRIRFDLKGVIATFHRPHPKKKPSLIRFAMHEHFLKKREYCHEHNEL